jgi:hypothetical protein
MNELILKVQGLRIRLKNEAVWSDEGIVHAIREMSYDPWEAGSYLCCDGELYPPTSAPGQQKFLNELYNWDYNQT